jgi:hypothetical protein
MAQHRRRVKHTASFEQRLAAEAQKCTEAAEKQPAGSHARELLLRRARQARSAAHINDWLTSPGLQPPKEWENRAGAESVASLPDEHCPDDLLRRSIEAALKLPKPDTFLGRRTFKPFPKGQDEQ